MTICNQTRDHLVLSLTTLYSRYYYSITTFQRTLHAMILSLHMYQFIYLSVNHVPPSLSRSKRTTHRVEPGYSEVHKSDRSFHYSYYFTIARVKYMCVVETVRLEPGFQYSQVHYSQVRLFVVSDGRRD